SSCLAKPKETRREAIDRSSQAKPMESPPPSPCQCRARPVIHTHICQPRRAYHCSPPGRPAACMCLSLVSSFLRFLASAAVAALSLSSPPPPPWPGAAPATAGALLLSTSSASVSEQGSSSVSSSAVAPLPAGSALLAPRAGSWNAAAAGWYAADGDPRGSATTG
ncbi:hypothetical protein BS78_05G056100, partial [Paspalum vaginatum]